MKKFLISLFLIFFSLNVFGALYNTTFTGANENPISENSHWINGGTVGLDWSDCAINNHIAYGAQTTENPSGNPFNDSTAVLTGTWAPNQSATATVYIDRSGNLNNSFLEMELRLNTTISAHSITGYEIDFSANVPPTRTGYIFIVRWNGPFGSFTGVGPGTNGAAVNLHTGDIVSANNSNGVIRVYINGTNFLTATDTTYTGGSPGIGFDIAGDHSLKTGLGFSSFSAYDGINWYVDNNATGANNGHSWTDAWKYPTNIVWSSIQPSDSLYISGGPDGNTNTYFGDFSDQSGSPNHGTQANPIHVRVGQDPLHNGKVKIVGHIQFSRDYWYVDFRKNINWYPQSVIDTYYTPTNCNLEMFNTNNINSQQGLFMQGTGSKLYGLHVSRYMKTRSGDAAIYYGDAGTSHLTGNGSEIAYCWISDADGFGIRGELGDHMVALTFGQMYVHHNLIENVHDNFMQFNGYTDFGFNVCRNHPCPAFGHPDCTQEMSVFSRIFNNIFYNHRGARVYFEWNDTLNHDCLVYNNVWFSFTNWYDVDCGGTIENEGTAFDGTGHDRGVGDGAPCMVSNIWEFHNTQYIRATTNASPSAHIWSSGPDVNGPNFDRLGTVSNYLFMDNLIIPDPFRNNYCLLQFPTNIAPNYVGFSGFEYKISDVKVDYNAVVNATSKGKGISFGDGGKQDLSNQYNDMAAFAAATSYKSNNNNTYKAISLPATNTYTRDPTFNFYPQIGDLATVKQGTNLNSVLTNIAPFMGIDLYGTPRPLSAATTIGAIEIPQGFWVATNGLDSNPGTFFAPWKTIQKAVNTLGNGDIANVTIGDYNEYVTTPDNLTAPGASYTLRAYPPNDPNNPVVTRQIRILHKNVTIEGFKITKPFGINGSHIRIEPPNGSGRDGSGYVITNCTLADGVMLKTHTASFGNNFVHITSAVEGVNFNNAGFVNGGQVFMGSDSFDFYTNCGPSNAANAPTVLSNSADGLTMFFQNSGMVPFQADPGTNYFAMLIAGNNGPASWSAVLIPVGSGGFPAASNGTIASCTFSNLIGIAINIGPAGGTNIIDGNTFRNLHGGYLFNLNASNVRISNNLLLDSPNVEYFAADSLSDPNLHPSGGQFYDWQCNLSIGNWPAQSNIWVYHNWFQGNGGELWETDFATNSFGIKFENDVFVGITQHGSENMDGTAFTNCTFFKVGYSQKENEPFAIGGTLTQPLNGGVVASTAFIDNGGHFNLSQEVPFGIPAGFYTNFLATNNYSVWPQTMLWSNTPANTWTNNAGTTLTGVYTNAGDPLFVNLYDPLGPDKLPFTADDGLRPLPNSFLSSHGIGALIPLATNAMYAHFSVKLASAGWKDATGTNFDSAWMALKPDQRTDDIRPWAVPEAVGYGTNSPVATIDCSGSWPGLGTITNYNIVFSDGGATVNTNSPFISHTFGGQVGTNTITLTITADTGSTSTFSQQVRVLGTPAGSDPTISAQPQNQTVNIGHSGTFSVTASGLSALNYQWYKNSILISGATSSTYTTPITTLSNNGDTYYVIVTDSAGSLQSSTAILTLNSKLLTPTLKIGTGIF